MKQFVLPLLVLIMSASALKAQVTAKDVFNRETKLTYLGIDFTKSRIIGDAGAKANEIVETHYVNMNQKVVNEPKRYDLSGAFNRAEVATAIGPVNKRNKKIDPDNVLSDDSDDYQALTPEKVSALVKGFDFEGKTGLGVLLVMEGFNKTKKELSAFVTFVDMKTKKVLFTERVKGELGTGFGYTNKYLTGVRSIVEDIRKNKYKEWKSTYGG